MNRLLIVGGLLVGAGCATDTVGVSSGTNGAQPVFPSSGCGSASRLPTLRWMLSEGRTGARVELCADRACTRVRQTLDAAGTSVTLAQPLEPGVVFWRVRGRRGASIDAPVGPVWTFRVLGDPRVTHTRCDAVDFDDDGYADLVVPDSSAEDPFRPTRVRGFRGTAMGFVQRSPMNINPGSGRLRLVGDADGDGTSDMLSTYPQREALLGDRSGMLRRAGPFASVSLEESFGDLDGDGHTDSFDVSPPGIVFGDSPALVAVQGSFTEGRTTRTGRLRTALLTEPGDRVATYAADLNGDGFEDALLLSASTGAMDVIFGGASWRTALPTVVSLHGPQVGAGATFEGRGDFDGDGFIDVVLATRYGAAPRFVVLRGGPQGFAPGAPFVLPMPLDPGETFYARVVGADLDGDGRSDIAIGRPGARGGRGLVQVFRGAEGGLDPTPAYTLEGGAAEGEDFGAALTAPGDTNDDGYTDLVVGAPSWHRRAGRLHVFRGGPQGPTAPAADVVEGVGAGGELGQFMAGVGDTNGDGFDDVVLFSAGTSAQEPTESLRALPSHPSYASVYVGSARGLQDTPATRIPLPDIAAWRPVALGDIDGDGLADFVLHNAQWHRTNVTALFFFGRREGVPSEPDVVRTYPGAAIAFEDLDRDGRREVLYTVLNDDGASCRVVAERLTARAASEGEVRTLVSRFEATVVGAVGAAGDLNGDGLPELVLSAWVWGGWATYAFSDGVAFAYRAPPARAWFGIERLDSFQNTGDLNGDGLPDLLLHGNRQGALRYGSAEPPRDPTASPPRLGLLPLGGSADFNGDGVPDLLALTPREEDRAGHDLFFYPGGAGFETLRPARLVLTPSLTRDGYIVNLPTLAVVGDLDHDGHPDVLVSDVADRERRGVVYVFRGDGRSVSASPSLVLEGNDGVGGTLGATFAQGR